MLATKTNTKEKSVTSPKPESKKGVAEEAAPQTQLNPLWHGLATHVGNNAAAGAGDPSPIQRKPSHSNSSSVPHIQRMCAECDEELITAAETPIQTKLTVAAPDDPYEKEADAVADKVMRMPVGGGQEEYQGEVPSIQSKPFAVSPIQRMRSEWEKEQDSGAPVIQKKPNHSFDHGQSSAPDSVMSTIKSPGSGSPLSESVRSRVEPVLGADLSSVRVHTDSQSQLASRNIQAKAFTHGNNIFLGAGQSHHDTKLMAHEATHTVQQSVSSDVNNLVQSESNETGPIDDIFLGTGHIAQQPSERQLTSQLPANPLIQLNGEDEICTQPNVGTFALDPAIEHPAVPNNFTTSIRIQPPGNQGKEQYLDFDREVYSATRLTAIAVALAEVYETADEATSASSCELDRELPEVNAGQQVYTYSGPFTVQAVASGYVIADGPVPEAAGAGAVVVLETEAGTVLLDAGMQLNDEGASPAIGDNIASQMYDSAVLEIGEAVLSPSAANGYVMPYIAGYFSIGSVRVTQDQLANDIGNTLSGIQAGQQDYRRWLEESLRAELDGSARAAWELDQPIAANNAIREDRWQRYRETVIADMLGTAGQPVLNLLGESDSGALTLPANAAVGAASDSPNEPTDLSGIEWEESNDEMLLIVGGGRIGLTSSAGYLLRPSGRRGPTLVSNLRAEGPRGPATAAPAATPWFAVASVGKEGLMMVRTSRGRGILVDAGGSAAVIEQGALTRMQAELGVSTIERIVVTHPHTDHIRQLQEIIIANGIRAEHLVVAASWRDSPVMEALRTTTRTALTVLGYGAGMVDGVPLNTDAAVTHTRIRLAEGELNVYAHNQASETYAQQRGELRAGTRNSMRSPLADSSGFMSVAGNESSANRVAVISDYRGGDITAMRDGLGTEGFRDALAGVRVIKGMGHHFSLTAGRTPADIAGMELLVRETLLRNGELTIMVQTKPGFAFGSSADPGVRGELLPGAEGAFLRWATAQGARVVITQSPGDASGGAIVDSNLQASTYGVGARIYEADPRMRRLLNRIQVLREARGGVIESAEFGPRALGLEGRNAVELQAELSTEIRVLEAQWVALQGQESADFLDARGPHSDPAKRDHTSAAERDAFRAARTVEGETAADILTRAEVRGSVEASLSTEVVARLRLAVAGGASAVSRLELANTPRAMADTLEGASLAEGRRTSLARRYRELVELTGSFEGEHVPENLSLEVLGRARLLRDELNLAKEEMTEAERGPVEAELARVEHIVERLTATTESRVELGRDVQGRLTRTEYIEMRRAQQSETVVKRFHQLGRVFGGLMVIHSVQEMGSVAAGYNADEMNIPEAGLRFAHSAYGLNIGVRMLRAAPKPITGAVGAARGVRGWEFAVLAVLEVGAAAAADYDSSEERDAAIAGTALHSSVNLLCLAAGQAIMAFGAGPAVPHPLAKLGVMGFGLAVTLAGETILGWAGLDDDVVRWTSFAPGEVTHVQQTIDSVLNDYELIIGTNALAQRSEEDLHELGADNPGRIRALASSSTSSRRALVEEKEMELVGLFEEAYDEARDAHVGLRSLDAMAARFTRLRHQAMAGTSNPRRDDIQARFARMDQSLQLTNASEGFIRGMAQWSEQDDKVEEVHDAIYGVTDRSVDGGDAFESAGELQLLIENARYRIDSSQSGLRPSPMLAEGRARDVYLEELRERETALANLMGRLTQMSAESFGGVSGPSTTAASFGPETALRQLLSTRENYNAVVDSVAHDLALAIPGFGGEDVWADPARLARQTEDASNDFPALFSRLRVAELALQLAQRQATSSLVYADASTSVTVRESIQRETQAARLAMAARKTRRGIIFPGELDVVLRQRLSDADTIFAVEIDQAFPSSRTSGDAEPITDAENHALRDSSGIFGYGRLTSTRHQLGAMRGSQESVRSWSPGTELDYNKMNRVVDRQYATISNPFRYYDDGWIVTFPEYSFSSSLQPLVTVVPGRRLGSKSNWNPWTAAYQAVMPANADAYQALGGGTWFIRADQLHGISAEQIRERAAEAGDDE